MSSSSSLCIGIDLGTTNCCTSCFRNGVAEILENKEGERTTPSFLWFQSKSAIMVGKYAKNMASLKPKHCVYEVKRLMGRDFSDPNLQKNLKYFPFEVKNASGKPMILVNTPDEVIEKTPEQLSAYILKKLKTDVEDKLGETITKAVITVPAYFNINQREATLEAAREARFEVLKLLNEPSAAALHFFHQRRESSEGYSLVYDLGGGTFDVAILKKTGSDIEIVYVDGDTHLGGNDFDNLIQDYILSQLPEELISNDRRRTFRRLKNKCEDAKKELSTMEKTNIYIENEDVEKEVSLTRQQFEKMAHHLFSKTIEIIKTCLKNAKLSKSDIIEIILSGGSTRIPKIQQMISEFFDGKKLNKFNNFDECVAQGAAIQAALISTTHPAQSIDQITLTDVVPLSLGIEVLGGYMDFLIRRNTPIPVCYISTRFNHSHTQTGMIVRLYEGERTDVRKNYFLGDLIIDNLTPAPPSDCKVIITLTIDHNGILNLTLKEEFSDNIRDLKVVYTRDKRSDRDINSVITDARENEEEDAKFLKFARSKQFLITYCHAVLYNCERDEIRDECRHLPGCVKRCREILNLAHKIDIDQEERIELLTNEIKGRCAVLEEAYHFEHMPTNYT